MGSLRTTGSSMTASRNAFDGIHPASHKAPTPMAQLSESKKPSSAVLIAATEAVLTAINKVPDIALICNPTAQQASHYNEQAQSAMAAQPLSSAEEAALAASPDALGAWPQGSAPELQMSPESLETAAVDAAGSGNLHVLAWLRSQQLLPLSRHVCFEAILRQQVPTLEWLRFFGPPWPWGTDACVAAVLSRGTDSLQWLLAQEPAGCRQQCVASFVDKTPLLVVHHSFIATTLVFDANASANLSFMSILRRPRMEAVLITQLPCRESGW